MPPECLILKGGNSSCSRLDDRENVKLQTENDGFRQRLDPFIASDRSHQQQQRQATVERQAGQSACQPLWRGFSESVGELLTSAPEVKHLDVTVMT